MERCIPHVIDIFECSPGARRRRREQIESESKSPSSDSAVSLGSSDEDGQEESISRYFDYLDNHDSGGEEFDVSDSFQSEKKTKNALNFDNKISESLIPDKNKLANKNRQSNAQNIDIVNNTRNIKKNVKSEDLNCKTEVEKDFRHIERHLSMKKTIRKKMMKDLQHAFVEDPNDLKLDPKSLTKETKNNININNLTYRKKNLSKSEHNFLNMLKDDVPRDKNKVTKSLKEKILDKKLEINPSCKDKTVDVDSGCEGLKRDSVESKRKMIRCKSKDDMLAATENSKPESNKKSAFWSFFSGKKKTKT